MTRTVLNCDEWRSDGGRCYENSPGVTTAPICCLRNPGYARGLRGITNKFRSSRIRRCSDLAASRPRTRLLERRTSCMCRTATMAASTSTRIPTASIGGNSKVCGPPAYARTTTAMSSSPPVILYSSTRTENRGRLRHCAARWAAPSNPARLTRRLETLPFPAAPAPGPALPCILTRKALRKSTAFAALTAPIYPARTTIRAISSSRARALRATP